MKNICFRLLIFLPIFLLCGFFWDNISWTEINNKIDQKYPNVTNIDTVSLKNRLDKENYPILIDVRETEEFAVSHLPTAVNIRDADKVQYPPDSPIVVYCSVGLRSAKFVKELQSIGFTKAQNLRGSIFEWGNRGYPLVRGNSGVESVHPYNKKWGVLLKKELHQYAVETVKK